MKYGLMCVSADAAFGEAYIGGVEGGGDEGVGADGGYCGSGGGGATVKLSAYMGIGGT